MAVIECKKAGSGFKNTGAKEQSFFGQMVRTAVAIPGFSFASATEAKSLTAWQTAIAEKKIFPLYEVEELASENDRNHKLILYKTLFSFVFYKKAPP